MALSQSLQNTPDCVKTLLTLSKSLNSPSELLQSINWSTILTSSPTTYPDISRIITFILARNNPQTIKDLIHSLLKSIFSYFSLSLNLPKIVSTLVLHQKTFKDLSELKIFTYSILQKYPTGSHVSESDQSFLVSLFNHHPRGNQKLLNLTHISVGLHKLGETQTKCFIIEKEKEKSDISYIKAINGFLNFRQNVAEEDLLNKYQESVNQVIDLFIRVLKDNPLLLKFSKSALLQLSPHKSAEVKYLNFYIKNLLGIAEKAHNLLEFSIKLCIEKLIEVETDCDTDKFDQLTSTFLCFIHKNYSSLIFKIMLKVFESHILSTFQTQYVQFIFLNLCEKTQTNPELFLSVLIKSIFLHKYVLAASSYLASFLLIYPNLYTISVKYLLYYCLKNSRIASRLISVRQVIKYAIFLICYKPELQFDTNLMKKLQKLLKKHNFLKGLSLQEGLDYSELVKLANFTGELCFTTLSLPFHTDLPSFKYCSIYFQQVPFFLTETKRKRLASIEVPSTLQLKRRAFSIDENKLFERTDTSSIGSVTSFKH